MKLRRYIVLILVTLLFICGSISVSAEAVLKLPASLEIIEDEAFFGASSLGKVVLSDRVRVIGKKAFANSSLTEIEIPNPSIEIADDAFDNHGANLLIKGRSGSTAETYAVAHNIRFATLETTVIVTSSWEDFAGASSSLVHSFEGNVSVSDEGSPYANGRLIVKMDGELPDLSQFNPEVIVRDPENHYMIQFSDSDVAEMCAEYLYTAPSVVYVEPDQNLHGSDMYIDDFETESYSWGVSATNADAYAADLRKRGINTQVIVAVVDTGVDFNHPMLNGRLVSGYDFVDNDGTPQDGNKHGTHVSGTVVDCTPGLNVKIMPVRVLNNSGSGSTSVVAQGIRYAARSNANVINLSLGGGHSSYIDEAVEYALLNGVTVVVAAGNESDNTANHCPAHISDCITVSAVNQSKQRAYFSNYGNAVDLAAPGVNITSAIPGGGYASLNGTSMATPHVSAAAAMVICDNPGVSPANVSSMLRNAATDLGASGWDAYFGAGFLNLESFIKSGPKQYTVSYNANGGTGAPASQTKVEGITLTLSSTKPSRAESSGSYTVTLNANGGSVSPASLTAARTTSYSFRNWNTKADGSGTSYSLSSSYSTEADVTLYAQWNSNTTTESVTLPTPIRTGYIFKGWATTSGASSSITGSYTPSGNVTLYAIWDRITYTVSYNANGGSGEPASQTKTHGSTLTLSPNTPTRANSAAGSYTVTFNANGGSVSVDSMTAARTTSYSFLNWNTVANGSGTSYAPGSNYTANADATLYAQWNSSTTTDTIRLPVPTRDGYTFKGWSTSSSATAGSTGIYRPTSNVMLYATWERTTYTVSYDANGGSDAPSSQTKEHGTALTLSTVKPIRSNSSAGSYIVTLNANGGSVSPSSLTAARITSYSFKNWNTKADGSGTSYTSGANYTTDAALILYAQWTSNTTTEAVNLPTPTRSSYAFKGWATSSSASSGMNGSYIPDGSVTLYAVWEELPKFTVSYDANGGTGAPAGQTKIKDANLTLSTVRPAKSCKVTLDYGNGYMYDKTVSSTFTGWNTKADGTGTQYASGATYGENAAATLYAQWNDGTLDSLPTPTRDGYTFTGWFTKATGGSSVTTSTKITGNMTIYAHWEQIVYYTVSYNANGGTDAPDSQTKTHGTSLTLSSATPSKLNTVTLNDGMGGTSTRTVNAAFDSWNTDADGKGTRYTPGAIYAEDASTTLYAQWTNGTLGELPALNRSSFAFDGWYTAPNGGTKVTAATTVTEDFTIYGHWTPAEQIGVLLENSTLRITGSGQMDSTAVEAIQAYRNASVTDVEISSGITNIADYAFDGFETITHVSIPDSVTSIGAYAFSNCKRLLSIAIPNSVTEIGSYAFQYCYCLSSVSLPDNMNVIEPYLFYHAGNLRNVHIPLSCVSIGTYSFYDAFDFHAITEVIGPGAGDEEGGFESSSLEGNGDDSAGNTDVVITIPAGVRAINSCAFGANTYLDKIIFENGNNIEVAEDFVSGCYTSLIIEAPSGSDVANAISTYRAYLCEPVPEIDRP